jgi:hypothetical protein
MAVPTIDDGPISPRPIRAARLVVVIAAVSLWLGACVPIEDRSPPTAAGTNPPSVEPAAAPGPIALAPSITGAAAPVPAPGPVPPPLPLPPPPVPAAAVETPPFAPASCPPGAIAMWRAPDAAGAPVTICRPFHPSR